MSENELLREVGDGVPARVTNMELFFDLVFVSAFTQLSSVLYGDLTLRGALQTLVIFTALWWSWNYTAWATGWIDPERRAVVALLAVLMVLNLLMVGSIAEAFGHRGALFAVAYVTVQLLRGGFMVRVFGWRTAMGRNHLQLLTWMALSGSLWLVGALVHSDDTRLGIWAGAALVELLALILGFRLPGAGPVTADSWMGNGAHFAERCELLVIIAFGESFLRIGESFAHTPNSLRVNVAFVLGFLLTFALWAAYFLQHDEQAAATLDHDDHALRRAARSGWVYAHALMVGAVVVGAVAIHTAIEGPDEAVAAGFAATCIGAPVLFLLAIAISRLSLGQGQGRVGSAAVGLALVVVAGLLGSLGDRLVEMALVTGAAATVSVMAVRVTGSEPGSA